MKNTNKKIIYSFLAAILLFGFISSSVFALLIPTGKNAPVSPRSKIRTTKTCKHSKAINFTNRGQHDQKLCIYSHEKKVNSEILYKRCSIQKITLELHKGKREWRYSSRNLEIMKEVKILQKYLMFNGFGPGPVDGFFGPLTEAGVFRAQKYFKVETTGIVDSETKMLINKFCK